MKKSTKKNDNPKWVESLRSYLQSMPVKDRPDFAERCGTTIGQLNMISWGNNSCNVQLAVALHRETDGVVSMEEMYPSLDWDYLRTVMAGGTVTLDVEAVKKALHDAIEGVDLQKLPVKLADSNAHAHKVGAS